MQSQISKSESSLHCFNCGKVISPEEMIPIQLPHESAKPTCPSCAKKLKKMQKQNHQQRTSRIRYFLLGPTILLVIITSILLIVF